MRSVAFASLALLTLFASPAHAQPAADRPTMIAVPGDDSRPAFEISMHEVTFDQWDACVRGGGCAGNPTPDDAGFGRGSRPVVNVSHADAEEYVTWLSRASGQDFRLPSAAEWQRAAGAIPEDLAAAAWIMENAGMMTHPVGEKSANALGLYDMYGNVAEWVADCTNPACVAYPLKGGAWDYPERFVRSSASFGGTSPLRRSSIGFRIARSIP